MGNGNQRWRKFIFAKNREGVERGFTAKELKEQEADEWEKQLPYFKNGKVSAVQFILQNGKQSTI